MNMVGPSLVGALGSPPKSGAEEAYCSGIKTLNAKYMKP